MRRQQDLRAARSANPAQDRRKLAYHRGMERQLGFLQEYRSGIPLAFQQGPEQADQAQRAVREVLLILPRRLRPPVLVARLQVPLADFVLDQVESVQLRDRRFQRMAYPIEASSTGPQRGPGDPKQKVGATRVVASVSPAIRIADQLRDQVEVPDRTKVIDDLAKLAVGVDLLQVCLRHPLRIVPVFARRPLEYRTAVSLDNLASENGGWRPRCSAVKVTWCDHLAGVASSPMVTPMVA